MNKYSFFKTVGVVSLIAFLSCRKTEVLPQPEPFLDISTKEVTFTPEAGTQVISIDSHQEFTALSSSSWCTVSPSKGHLKISVIVNQTAGEKRTADIAVHCGDLTDKIVVTQFGDEASVLVKETDIIINTLRPDYTFTLDITANVPVIFALPKWIVEKNDNEPVIGRKTYSFQATTLPVELEQRIENLVVKYADVNLAVIPVKQTSQNCAMSVGTYNILIDLPSWDEYRGTLVNNLIRQYDFDIIGMQEVRRSFLEDITLRDRIYAFTGKGGSDGIAAGEHAPIVYKKDRLKLLNSGTFWLSDTPDVPSVGWDARWVRTCSWGRFMDKISGLEFYIFSAHVEAVDIASIESSKLLLSKIKSIAGNNTPAFLVGDFNSRSLGESISILLNDGLLKDSYDLSETEKVGSEGTYNDFLTKPSTTRIDYIFVTEGIRVKEYKVLNDRPGGQFPSDHDPVLIVAEF